MVILLLIPEPLVHHLLVLLVQLANVLLLVSIALLVLRAFPLVRLLHVLHVAVPLVRHLDALVLLGPLVLAAVGLVAIHLLLLLRRRVALDLPFLLQLLAHILLAFAFAHPSPLHVVLHTALAPLVAAALVLRPHRAEAFGEQLGKRIREHELQPHERAVVAEGLVQCPAQRAQVQAHCRADLSDRAHHRRTDGRRLRARGTLGAALGEVREALEDHGEAGADLGGAARAQKLQEPLVLRADLLLSRPSLLHPLLLLLLSLLAARCRVSRSVRFVRAGRSIRRLGLARLLLRPLPRLPVLPLACLSLLLRLLTRQRRLQAMPTHRLHREQQLHGRLLDSVDQRMQARYICGRQPRERPRRRGVARSAKR